MKRLIQQLNTQDDSFSYTVMGEREPTYKVDSNAELIDMKEGRHIGKFKLKGNAWHLYINDVLIESSPPGSTFYLPEFELKSLTELVNK